MIEMIIGALIAIGSIGFSQYLQYVLSTKKEKRNLKIQSINKFKKTILKLRVHIAEIIVVPKEEQMISSLKLLIELIELSGHLYTLPETKDLAEKVDDLINDYDEYRKSLETKDVHKIREKLRNKIQKLQKESI